MLSPQAKAGKGRKETTFCPAKGLLLYTGKRLPCRRGPGPFSLPVGEPSLKAGDKPRCPRLMARAGWWGHWSCSGYLIWTRGQPESEERWWPRAERGCSGAWRKEREPHPPARGWNMRPCSHQAWGGRSPPSAVSGSRCRAPLISLGSKERRLAAQPVTSDQEARGLFRSLAQRTFSSLGSIKLI